MSKMVAIPDYVILNKTLVIRDKRVMIDSDLTELYGVTTKRLNEQVKRNMARFPKDFMFQLNKKEKDEVVANCDHLENLKFSPYLPNVFTEHGAVMLASVLNSDRAIKANIQIVRIFTTMRELVVTNKDLLLKVKELKSEIELTKSDIKTIFEVLKKLIQQESEPREAIGYKPKGRKR